MKNLYSKSIQIPAKVARIAQYYLNTYNKVKCQTMNKEVLTVIENIPKDSLTGKYALTTNIGVPTT